MRSSASFDDNDAGNDNSTMNNTNDEEELQLELPSQSVVEPLAPLTGIIPIQCGKMRGFLHHNLYICPGIHVKCITLHADDDNVDYSADVFITPKDFTVRAEKDKQKDWKGAIRADGVTMRTLHANGRLEFFEHETRCQSKCKSRNHINTRDDEFGARRDFSEPSCSFNSASPMTMHQVLVKNEIEDFEEMAPSDGLFASTAPLLPTTTTMGEFARLLLSAPSASSSSSSTSAPNPASASLPAPPPPPPPTFSPGIRVEVNELIDIAITRLGALREEHARMSSFPTPELRNMVAEKTKSDLLKVIAEINRIATIRPNGKLHALLATPPLAPMATQQSPSENVAPAERRRLGKTALALPADEPRAKTRRPNERKVDEDAAMLLESPHKVQLTHTEVLMSRANSLLMCQQRDVKEEPLDEEDDQ